MGFLPRLGPARMPVRFSCRYAFDRKVVEPNRIGSEHLRKRPCAAIIRNQSRRQWFIRHSSWPLYSHTVNSDKA
jgi:hypothetical protein